MNDLPPRPRFKDWGLFGFSLLSTLFGAFMLADRPREGLLPFTFFGACTATFGYLIFRKLRRRRFAATSVSVVGGVALRISKARALMFTAMLAVPGAAIFLTPAPWIVDACGVVMLATAAWLLFAIFTGRISRRFLRFDPPGLTVGEANWQTMIPWDEIVHLIEFEISDNATVGFDIAHLNAAVVTPAVRRQRALKKFIQSLDRSGRHVVIMPMHFGVPAETLCAAIRHYAEDPTARAGLANLPVRNRSRPPARADEPPRLS